MIKYTLKCENDHRFESWFDGLEAFEKLAGSKMLQCVECGSFNVDRAVMTPRVSASRDKAKPLAEDIMAAQKAISEYRDHVDATCEDVGKDFAKEARAIHEGSSPKRSIRGEAKLQEARDLIEDGVPVVPIPNKAPKTN